MKRNFLLTALLFGATALSAQTFNYYNGKYTIEPSKTYQLEKIAKVEGKQAPSGMVLAPSTKNDRVIVTAKKGGENERWQIIYLGDETFKDKTEAVPVFNLKHVSTGKMLSLVEKDGKVNAFPELVDASQVDNTANDYAKFYIEEDGGKTGLKVRVVYLINEQLNRDGLGRGENTEGTEMSADNVIGSNTLWIPVEMVSTGIKDINTDAPSKANGIYTISGQLVRKNAENTDGLKAGLYIVNGKKVVVK